MSNDPDCAAPKVAIVAKGWRCKGNVSTPDGPGECNWPFCGCDPGANEMIAHFQECGLKLVNDTSSDDQRAADDRRSITQREFINGLKILRSIEIFELPLGLSPQDVLAFMNDPYRFLISCSDRKAAAIYTIIESRQPKVEAHADR